MEKSEENWDLKIDPSVLKALKKFPEKDSEMQNLFKEYEGIFETENVEQNSDTKQKKERIYAYSPFALQNAIGEKSAKKAWIEYQKLIFADIAVEDFIHKIISKVRDMAAIKMGAGKEDLGIQKDWLLNKSKKDAKNWKPEDLKNFYTRLISIYHQSRMESGSELDIALEKTLLSI